MRVEASLKNGLDDWCVATEVKGTAQIDAAKLLLAAKIKLKFVLNRLEYDAAKITFLLNDIPTEGLSPEDVAQENASAKELSPEIVQKLYEIAKE